MSRTCDHCLESMEIEYDYRGGKLCHDCYGELRGLDRLPLWTIPLTSWIVSPEPTDSRGVGRKLQWAWVLLMAVGSMAIIPIGVEYMNTAAHPSYQLLQLGIVLFTSAAMLGQAFFHFPIELNKGKRRTE